MTASSQGPQLDAAADEDLAEQARPGHGVPSQDPSAGARFALEPEEARREAHSVYAGGGVLAGAAAGAAMGAAVAGPVGVLVGGTVGSVGGALGGARLRVPASSPRQARSLWSLKSPGSPSSLERERAVAGAGRPGGRDLLFHVAQAVLAEEHLVAHEEGGRTKGAPGMGLFGAGHQRCLDFGALGQGQQPFGVQVGVLQFLGDDGGVVHLFLTLPHAGKHGVDIGLEAAELPR
ncbi:hypothetical protein FQR65_LT20261 [Abscondita terminalis]|nr:hypothetical protein FQR65_LT20261 [Abscondita terminalis]